MSDFMHTKVDDRDMTPVVADAWDKTLRFLAEELKP